MDSATTKTATPVIVKKTAEEKSKKLKIRVGQFNVLNLVKEESYFYGKEKYTKEKVEEKVAWIAQQLKKMNAGIVGFEEVFHTETLQRAIDASGLYKSGELVCFGADGSKPCVALVSNYKITKKESIANFPKEALLKYDGHEIPVKSFSRPILRVVLELPSGDPCTVFVAHLKSKRPIVEDSCRHDQKAKAIGHALSLIVRAAEAAALRCILVEEMEKNDQPVMVIGDLNDVVHCVTTEIITGTPPWKNLPKNQKEKIWDSLLWSTNEVQVRSSDRDVTYSHIHNGRYEVLDHILVSQEFVRSNPNHIGYVQFLQLFTEHLIDETLSEEKQNKTQSDHAQVVASIRLWPRLDESSKME